MCLVSSTTNNDYAVVQIESTNPYANGVAVNPVRAPRGGKTFLVDPADSEEATEPFLSNLPTSRVEIGLESRIDTGTDLQALSAFTTTEEDPHIRWRLPSSLLATG
jgi:hypothetical protein